MSSDNATIFGKKILVGLTYLDKQGQVVRKLQIHGLITRLESNNTLYFDRADGEGEFSIPFEGELEPAECDAVYTLSSTGEKIENVHFVSSWTIHPPQNKNNFINLAAAMILSLYKRIRKKT